MLLLCDTTTIFAVPHLGEISGKEICKVKHTEHARSKQHILPIDPRSLDLLVPTLLGRQLKCPLETKGDT
jgi:hypothetical protein